MLDDSTYPDENWVVLAEFFVLSNENATSYFGISTATIMPKEPQYTFLFQDLLCQLKACSQKFYMVLCYISADFKLNDSVPC